MVVNLCGMKNQPKHCEISLEFSATHARACTQTLLKPKRGSEY